MCTVRTRRQARSWLACWLFCALVFGFAAPVRAEDFTGPPVSPIPIVAPGSVSVGPATYTRWSGFYFGGQFGLSNGNADFSASTSSTIAYALRNTALEDEFAPSQWQILGTANLTAPTYGGFVGYNTQWEDVTVGIEANLNHAGFALNAASTPIGPLTTAADSFGDTHTLTMSGSGSVSNFDFATLRLRAGYVIGNFMPYIFGGAAFSLSTVSISVSGSDLQCTTTKPVTCNQFPFGGSSSYNNEVLYGYTAGLGVDFAVTPNLFLRAEFEWDQFNPPPGIMMSIVTGRVGAGLKF